jgi:hypothetical protein
MSDASPPSPAPRGRVCAGCGAALRFSHRAYAGAGRSADVLRCSGCGLTYGGAERDAAEAERRRSEQARARREKREAATRGPTSGEAATRGATAGKPGRRPLDEGAPENPVIDEATARLLREQLGG